MVQILQFSENTIASGKKGISDTKCARYSYIITKKYSNNKNVKNYLIPLTEYDQFLGKVLLVEDFEVSQILWQRHVFHLYLMQWPIRKWAKYYYQYTTLRFLQSAAMTCRTNEQLFLTSWFYRISQSLTEEINHFTVKFLDGNFSLSFLSHLLARCNFKLSSSLGNCNYIDN